METQKLIKIGNELTKEEATFNFQTNLTELKDLYSQSKSNADLGSQIEEKLNILSTMSHSSPTNELPPSYIRLIGTIGGQKYTGSGVSDTLGQIIKANQYNIDNIVSHINEFTNKRQEFLNKLKSLNETLLLLNISDETSTEFYELGVIIPDKKDLTTIPKIERHLHNWNILLKQLSEMTGQGTADIKIHKAGNGSIELYVQQTFEVIDCVATMATKVGVLYLTINEIRKHREALKKLKAPAAETKEIEKHEKAIIDEEIESTVVELTTKYKKTIPKGREDELSTAINKGMRFIARTIDSGIEVEIVPPTIEAPELQQEGDTEEVTKTKEEKKKKFETHKERAKLIKKTGEALKGISGLGDTTLKMLTGGDDKLDD